MNAFVGEKLSIIHPQKPQPHDTRNLGIVQRLMIFKIDFYPIRQGSLTSLWT